jgi:hypothetical protein
VYIRYTCYLRQCNDLLDTFEPFLFVHQLTFAVLTDVIVHLHSLIVATFTFSVSTRETKRNSLAVMCNALPREGF